MNGKREELPRRRSSAEVERIVAGYEGSGLSKQAFCEKHGLSMSTLDRHRKRQQKQLQSHAAEQAQWVAVEVSDARQERGTETGRELVVRLASGRRIEVGRGFDAKGLQELVRALERI